MMKMVACYIRHLKVEKDPAVQRREINRWLKRNRISRKSVRWYIDKATKGKRSPPKLKDLHADIRDDKVRAVVVWHLDRLSGSTRDRLNFLMDWCDRPLRVVSVTQQIDVKPGSGKMISSVLYGLTEVHEQTMRARTMPGREAARARRRLGGRPKVTADDARVQMVKKLHKDGELSIDEICKRLKISPTTYFRYLNL
jgi:DNA invertase Pin-like site-specific DNA recombinase